MIFRIFIKVLERFPEPFSRKLVNSRKVRDPFIAYAITGLTYFQTMQFIILYCKNN